MTSAAKAPGDWDPPAQAREWVTHTKEGSRGWKVKRGGRDYVKLDNPAFDHVIVYRESEWRPEHDHRPLTRWAIAKVAFEADKALCVALGQIALSKREWIDLKEEARLAWMQDGPTGSRPEDKIRRGLWARVMAELEPLAA